MRSQQRSWSCGPAALVNICRALGRRVAEGRARVLAGTTKAGGTDELGLISAARSLGLTAAVHSSSDKAAAWAFIRSNVADGRPCLLCIDQWQHWVAAIGVVGDRVLIHDPANTKANVTESGLHPLSRPDVIRRLRHQGEQNAFYVIAIGK